MVILVRKLSVGIVKLLMFVGLFVLSMRFIHTYPQPMPPEQLQYLFAISRTLGLRDPDDFYLSAVAIVNLIAATVEFKLLMRLWEKCRGTGSTKGPRSGRGWSQ